MKVYNYTLTIEIQSTEKIELYDGGIQHENGLQHYVDISDDSLHNANAKLTKGKISNVCDTDLLYEHCCFHEEIFWYTLDGYTESAQKKLTKLPIGTYTVSIGNTKVHYFTYELPKVKDFNLPGEGQLPDLLKKIRASIKLHPLFVTDKKVIEKAKAIINKKGNQI